MVERQVLESRWADLQEPLRTKWGQLTDHDLISFEGSGEDLVGLIQMRTGETKQDVEDQLEEVIAQSTSMPDKVVESLKRATSQTGEQIRDGYEVVTEKVSEGYHAAEDSVTRHPTESAAVAFGSGLVAGAILCLIIRR